MSYKTGTGLVIDMLNSGKRDEHVCSIITRKTAEHSDPEYLKNGNRTHCSKSSFFVQKFNFDFPRKIVEFFWLKNS